ncbi:predicted protein [Plenodomus lingam JN3]|uniref:Predicted protein n=1 Tax=Leptosphaeria maculans (strain JN3 / isolate v23.1.3 / race Av1-4-5-6-7-8) TaxID=985895 RepID=E4ZVR9_LEPMJ|nr:predicted protein [Plenodomus lingam JN3]CBX95695.1 predicted protein [Plenodomus lingam JN3]
MLLHDYIVIAHQCLESISRTRECTRFDQFPARRKEGGD